MCIEFYFDTEFCGSSALYWGIVLLGYPLLLYATQFVSTSRWQLHREALSLKPNDRVLNMIVLYRIIQSSISVISILLITSRNVGFILSALVGHAIAIYYVFKTQRRDRKHLVSLLVEALQDPSKRDELVRALSVQDPSKRDEAPVAFPRFRLSHVGW